MVEVALGGLSGKLSTSGHRENSHSHAPWSSHDPVGMVYQEGSKMVTVSLENMTLQSASQKGPIPMSKLLKAGNMCPLRI